MVCANDLIAIGALEAARAAGVALPADLAVIGFDDVDAASLVAPPLTTVVNPAYEMGRNCGRLLWTVWSRATTVHRGPSSSRLT